MKSSGTLTSENDVEEGNRFDSHWGNTGKPYRRGEPSRLKVTRLRVVEVELEARGGTREIKTICTSVPIKTHGGAGAEGSAHQTAPVFSSSFRCPVAFWSLGPGAPCELRVSPQPPLWKRPPRRAQET